MAKHRTPARRAQKGETLTEVLVALLIVALAALLMASMVTVSNSVNIAARNRDEAFYEALQTVEDNATEPDPVVAGAIAGMVCIYDADGTTPVSGPYSVNVYTKGNLALYK